MPKTVLVTGATGYIASRLIPRLLAAGYNVRCLARRPERLKGRTWYARVEVVAGDVTQPHTLQLAMQGVNAAYYLIHSMSVGHGYDRVDLLSARSFARAARLAGVEHIIYLGGLANPRDPSLARHLKSRIESGEALREAGVPVTEFRAGVIVGPGSVSFEMIRFIAEQFPIMAGPAWLRHRSQPIATSNVLDYLMAALTTPAARGLVVELGSPETYTYIDVMSRYARIRGLKRVPLLLPFFPVWFMAFFIDLLTPVEKSYAYPLVEGLQNDSLVSDRGPLDLFPGIQLLDYTSSVELALVETHPHQVERVWLDLDRDVIMMKHEGMFIDYRRASAAASHASLFAGLRRRVTGSDFRVGTINSFQVELLNEDTLRLRVTAPGLPGDAWLEWKVAPLQSVEDPGSYDKNGTVSPGDGARLEQTVFFAPKGLPGFLSWYLLRRFYQRLFAGLIRELVVSQA